MSTLKSPATDHCHVIIGLLQLPASNPTQATDGFGYALTELPARMLCDPDLRKQKGKSVHTICKRNCIILSRPLAGGQDASELGSLSPYIHTQALTKTMRQHLCRVLYSLVATQPSACLITHPLAARPTTPPTPSSIFMTRIPKPLTHPATGPCSP